MSIGAGTSSRNWNAFREGTGAGHIRLNQPDINQDRQRFRFDPLPRNQKLSVGVSLVCSTGNEKDAFKGLNNCAGLVGGFEGKV